MWEGRSRETPPYPDFELTFSSINPSRPISLDCLRRLQAILRIGTIPAAILSCLSRHVCTAEGEHAVRKAKSVLLLQHDSKNAQQCSKIGHFFVACTKPSSTLIDATEGGSLGRPVRDLILEHEQIA